MNLQTAARPEPLPLPAPLRKILHRVNSKAHNLYFQLLIAMLRSVPDARAKLHCLLEAEQELTAEQLLRNYSQGIFPMGNGATIVWKDPLQRAVIPLAEGGLQIGKELARIVRQNRFEVTIDRCFRQVMLACAERSRTWITPRMLDIYEELHHWGVAHSFEAWQDGQLVGGNYGVALGSIYMGESMFHRVSNAGNVVFVHQAEHLRQTGFQLIDCQYPTDYLLKLGAQIISRSDYKQRLARGLAERQRFVRPSPMSSPAPPQAVPSSQGSPPS